MSDREQGAAVISSDTPLWQWVEERIMRAVYRYGYQEIRLPILESAALFQGDAAAQPLEAADVVLRPDGTPGCIKAVIGGRGTARQDAERVWYQGPMFRQGESGPRQFHQFGVEAFGMPGADIDAELILLTCDMFAALGLNRELSLEVNTLGTWHEQGGPLGADSQRHFAALCHALDTEGVPYSVNPRLTSGRGYYSRTVFEWTWYEQHVRRVLCAGGRYDELAAQCCGRPLAASGFAFDFEHLLRSVARDGHFESGDGPQLVIRAQRPAQGVDAVLLSQRLRRQCPTLSVENQLSDESLTELPASAKWVVTLLAGQSAEIWSREHGWSRRVELSQVVDVVAGRARP